MMMIVFCDGDDDDDHNDDDNNEDDHCTQRMEAACGHLQLGLLEACPTYVCGCGNFETNVGLK